MSSLDKSWDGKYVMILNVTSGLFADLQDGKRDPGTPVNGYKFTGFKFQIWSLSLYNNSWYIVNRNSGTVMDSDDNQNINGQPKRNDKSQLWNITMSNSGLPTESVLFQNVESENYLSVVNPPTPSVQLVANSNQVSPLNQWFLLPCPPPWSQ